MLLAYLDPGSGTLIVQVILGTIAAMWALFRASGRNLLSMFVGRKAPPSQSDDVLPQAPESSANTAEPKL